MNAPRSAKTQAFVSGPARLHGPGIPGRIAELLARRDPFRLQTPSLRHSLCAENGPGTVPEGPFILVSSIVADGLATELLRLGARAYVSKINLEQLGPAIE